MRKLRQKAIKDLAQDHRACESRSLRNTSHAHPHHKSLMTRHKGDEGRIWRVTFVCFYPHPKQNVSGTSIWNIWLLFLRTIMLFWAWLSNNPVPSHPIPPPQCWQLHAKCSVGPSNCQRLSLCLHIPRLPNQTSTGKPQCLPLPKEKGSKMCPLSLKEFHLSNQSDDEGWTEYFHLTTSLSTI